MFTVDTTEPVFNPVTNISYVEGEIGNSITWNPSDINPSNYEILVDSISNQTGTWDGSSIVIGVDHHLRGTYEYTCIVEDLAGNTNSSSVWVTVSDGVNPTINQPENQTFEQGQTGKSIVWVPSDTYPSTYQIKQNTSVIANELWDGNNIVLDLDMLALTVGGYVFNCTVIDLDSNYVCSLVYVTVIESNIPLITSPGNQTIEYGQTGAIDWYLTDNNAQSFEIYLTLEGQTPSLVNSGTWDVADWPLNNVVVTYNYLDTLPLGEHNLTLVVIDSDGFIGKDSLFMNIVDTTSPLINNPDNLEYEAGESGYQITWICSDLNPDYFTVFMDSSTILSDDTWDGSNVILTITDVLEPGTYSYVCSIYDVSGNSVSNEVLVIVTDSIYPSINSPSDITYNEEDTGSYNILWTPNDSYPDSYSISIDGTISYSD